MKRKTFPQPAELKADSLREEAFEYVSFPKRFDANFGDKFVFGRLFVGPLPLGGISGASKPFAPANFYPRHHLVFISISSFDPRPRNLQITSHKPRNF